MALAQQLLDILACPQDKGPLFYLADENSLINPRLSLRYAITNDIPIMLIDKAEELDAGEMARITAKVEAEGLQPTFSE